MRGRKAFTLFELLTIVIIIATIAAIAVPNFLEAQIRSKNAQILTNQRLIAAALESYYVDYKAYPSNLVLVDFELTEREETKPRKYFEPAPHEIFEFPPEALMVGPQPAPAATTESTRTITATWRTSKKIPEDFSLHRAILVCPMCGFYSPLEANKCQLCGSDLDPADKTEVYSFSPDGSVLDALTTPIPYLLEQVNIDVYMRRRQTRPNPWNDRDPSPFCYVNFTHIKKDGLDIPDVPGKARYAVISAGPDLALQFINKYPVPAFVSYDPTNGTISPGDIITWYN